MDEIFHRLTCLHVSEIAIRVSVIKLLGPSLFGMVQSSRGMCGPLAWPFHFE